MLVSGYVIKKVEIFTQSFVHLLFAASKEGSLLLEQSVIVDARLCDT